MAYYSIYKDGVIIQKDTLNEASSLPGDFYVFGRFPANGVDGFVLNKHLKYFHERKESIFKPGYLELVATEFKWSGDNSKFSYSLYDYNQEKVVQNSKKCSSFPVGLASFVKEIVDALNFPNYQAYLDHESAIDLREKLFELENENRELRKKLAELTQK